MFNAVSTFGVFSYLDGEWKDIMRVTDEMEFSQLGSMKCPGGKYDLTMASSTEYFGLSCPGYESLMWEIGGTQYGCLNPDCRLALAGIFEQAIIKVISFCVKLGAVMILSLGLVAHMARF